MKRWVWRIGARKRERERLQGLKGHGGGQGRDQGLAAAAAAIGTRHRTEIPTCDEYVAEYLEDCARKRKASTVQTNRGRLRRFRADFQGRSLDQSRAELKDWIDGEGRWSGHDPVPGSQVEAVITLYNHAIDEGEVPLLRSPARKLGPRYRGRAEVPPPTPEEFESLLAACSVLGDYAKTMRALMLFAAYTLMRPGELFALEWSDIDFPAMRIRKHRRVYNGELDQPKTGPKLIALPEPALTAINWLSRDSNLVFPSRVGTQLSSSVFWRYWSKVNAAAGLDFQFYHATKHYGVHCLWTKLGLSPRAIAAQAGWKLETADKMLAVYGHGELGALAEIDAAFQRSVGFPGRSVGERLEHWQPRGSVGKHRQRSRAGGGRLGVGAVGAKGELAEPWQQPGQSLGLADEQGLVKSPEDRPRHRELQRGVQPAAVRAKPPRLAE